MELFALTTAFFVAGPLFSEAEAGCSMYCGQEKQPVCAHSPSLGYKNFPDNCAVEQANTCGGADWTLIHPGACLPTEIGGCPMDCHPVCGLSPSQGFKTFLSKCFLDVEAALSDFTFAHNGACTPIEVPPSVCPGVCTLDFNPVCGYSPVAGYKTFSNGCFLGLENKCHFGSYSLKHTGECTGKELGMNCQRSCGNDGKDSRPVCGLSTEKGYKTFKSLCSFYQENGCPKFDSVYKLLHDGACTTDEIAKFCQPGFCPEGGSPVCAASLPYYRTFSNKCLFYVENSCKYGDFQLIHTGECSESENQQSCNAKCSQDAALVCGFSDSRGYKTFLNRCFISYENACNGADYGAVHIGECKKGELELICSQQYCKQYKGSKVCGLSPTKGYTTFDNACFLHAQNTCKNGDYKLAHDGECTKEERGLFCLPQFCMRPDTPVCGLNKQGKYFTFPNECSLNMEKTCKKQEFTLKHKGKCTNPELGGLCPINCAGQDCQYICALSATLGYRTFYNKCAFESENGCNGGDYVFKHDGECTKPELEKNCQMRCSYDFKPVCALSPTKGYHTFHNKCTYTLDVSCYGSDYKFQYGGVCSGSTDVTTPSPLCQPVEAMCPSGYSPVCGYSKSNNAFQTFNSKCYFDAENKCEYDDDFILAHYGACTPDELGNNCQRKCGGDDKPICALSPTFGYKTVPNMCELLLALSCKRSDLTLAHEGQCTKQEAPVCSNLCSSTTNPVCGFSPSAKQFVTFNNKCMWQYENQCSYGDYVLVHPGACSPDELGNKCDRLTSTVDAPVCGYSSTRGYKTFQNIETFALDISCTGSDYVFSNEGICKYPEGPQKNCPALCDKTSSPVCAFSSSTKSFKTFQNQCLLAANNRCNYGDYVPAHPGKCTKEEKGKKCYRKCPLMYKPVCGFDVTEGYRTFPSLCELEVANKCDGADYSLAHIGKCTPKEQGGSCNFNCPLYYNGVCGFSEVKGFKTFANVCFLDRENTCTLSDYSVAHSGKCLPSEIGKKCNRECQLVYSPVCGKSKSKGYKTYPNFCLMDRDNSCNYLDYNVVHQGECFPWELCVNCKKN